MAQQQQQQQGKGKQPKQQQQQKPAKDDELSKAQQLFDSLKESNGNVATPKLRDYLKQQGMDDAWTNKALDQIDVNHDNEITWAEFGTKGIRVVQQLKLHADKVAREAKQKKAPAAKEVEEEAPAKQGASPAPAHRDAPASPSAHAASSKSPKEKQPKQQKKEAKSAKDSKPAAPVVASTFGLPPSAFEDLVPALLRNKNIQHRNKLRDKQEVLVLIQQTRPAGEYKEGRRKKKFLPKKPTHDEKGVYKRLRKHEATKAPAYEKTLLDKYKIKKRAAPAAAKK